MPPLRQRGVLVRTGSSAAFRCAQSPRHGFLVSPVVFYNPTEGRKSFEYAALPAIGTSGLVISWGRSSGRDDPGVDNNSSDIVPSSAVQRGLDEGIHSVLGMLQGAEDPGYLVVRKFAVEPVRADEDPVAVLNSQKPVIRLGFVSGAKGTGDHMAPRVNGGLLRSNLARLHEFLDLRVVYGDLLQTPAT